jgi:hypothetical protein
MSLYDVLRELVSIRRLGRSVTRIFDRGEHIPSEFFIPDAEVDKVHVV